jgi:hypothetical protein
MLSMHAVVKFILGVGFTSDTRIMEVLLVHTYLSMFNESG